MMRTLIVLTRPRLSRLFHGKHAHDVFAYSAPGILRHCRAEPRLVSNARGSMKYQHTVADFHRFVHLVSDEDGGFVALPDKTNEFGTQIACGHLIQGRERLVAQQDFRIDRKGARD